MAVSIVVSLDVPVDADGFADLRHVARAHVGVPSGSTVRLRCGNASTFVEHEVRNLAGAVRGAAHLQFEGSQPSMLGRLASLLRDELGGGRR